MEPIASRLVFIIGALNITFVVAWKGKVVFEDDFNGSSLDVRKWEYEEDCGFDFGRKANYNCYARKNVAVRNGKLHITVRRENMEHKQCTSGQVRQKGSGLNYGNYVARVRFFRGNALGPGFWLSNRDKCQDEEIHIAKYRGQQAGARNSEMGALWHRNADFIKFKGIKATTPFDLSKDYHEIAMVWLPSKITWCVDNRKYHEISLTDVTFTSNLTKRCPDYQMAFQQPLNLIFNIAVRDAYLFRNIPQLDPKTWTKPSLEVDWVRIYQK